MKRLNLSTLFDPVVENIAGFSKVQRILICVGVFVVLIGAFGYFSFYPKFNKIKELKASFEQLETKLSTSRIQAGQLSKYREKKKNAENQFKMVLKKLPEKKDIPSLLSAISRSGKDAGLDFVLFQPEAERVRDFYAEIPVAIQVAGSFHQVAQFFDKVSTISRIVTMQDIRMSSSPKNGGQRLQTSCKAVTYRFIPDSN